MINKEERIVVRQFFTFSGVASPALGQIDIRTINRYLRHLGSIVYRYAKSGYFAEPAVLTLMMCWCVDDRFGTSTLPLDNHGYWLRRCVVRVCLADINGTKQGNLSRTTASSKALALPDINSRTCPQSSILSRAMTCYKLQDRIVGHVHSSVSVVFYTTNWWRARAHFSR